MAEIAVHISRLYLFPGWAQIPGPKQATHGTAEGAAV